MIYCLIPTTKERRERLQKCVDSIHLNTKYPIAICTYENEEGCEDVGWVKAVHKLLEGINGICFILGDDAIIAPDCIEKLYEAYQEGYLLQPYEQINKGTIATFPFCHSNILKQYIHKGYIHNYSDTELTEIMKQKGKYLYIPEAKVDHQHFVMDYKLLDNTYCATKQFLEKDKQIFEERKKNNFEPKNI